MIRDNTSRVISAVNASIAKDPHTMKTLNIHSLVLLSIVISGCVANQPIPQPVMVEVSRPCLTAEQLPAPPVALTDAELAALNDHDFVLGLAQGRLEYRRYSLEAQAVLRACVK